MILIFLNMLPKTGSAESQIELWKQKHTQLTLHWKSWHFICYELLEIYETNSLNLHAR